MVKCAADLMAALRGIVPSDTMFHRDFSQASVSKQQIARYYLRVLESYSSGSANPALVPNPDTKIVNLEHILPKEPSLNWPQFTEEQVATYRFRLGNLALCETRINSLIGNMSFPEKVTRLALSPFKTTSSIATHKAWDIDAIEDRQARLADLAVKAWPFK